MKRVGFRLISQPASVKFIFVVVLKNGFKRCVALDLVAVQVDHREAQVVATTSKFAVFEAKCRKTDGIKEATVYFSVMLIFCRMQWPSCPMEPWSSVLAAIGIFLVQSRKTSHSNDSTSFLPSAAAAFSSCFNV